MRQRQEEQEFKVSLGNIQDSISKISKTKEGTFSLILASHAKSHCSQRTNSITMLKGKYQSQPHKYY